MSPDTEDLADTLNDGEQAPVITAGNIILAKALSEKASDIHVEPQEEFMRIRMRKDGVLQEYFRFPKQVVQGITARFKIIANLDIAERRQAQDGRIRRVFEGRTVDFRVNSLPSRYGEKIVLRILDSSSTQLGLGLLISDPETLALVRDAASRPFGLILVTGPTGSGKATSLYSFLALVSLTTLVYELIINSVLLISGQAGNYFFLAGFGSNNLIKIIDKPPPLSVRCY